MKIITLGGRRFVLTMGVWISSSVLLWFGKLTDGSYTAIILGIVGVYCAANTTQKIKAPESKE